MENTNRDVPDLPRPFYRSPWPKGERPAAEALWHWHHALTRAKAPALDGSDLTAYFAAERDKAAAAELLDAVPETVAGAAYDACRAHGLPLDLLAGQVMGARRFKEPIRFPEQSDLTEFIRTWATPHGLLLAKLAGAGHSWQERAVHELARGFFLTNRLARLPHDLRRDHLFVPEADLDAAGVSLSQLRAGTVDEHMRRLLWKQTIRIRDALAQGQPLVKELPRRYAGALKRAWLGALEVVSEIERRDYDLWSGPIRLSPLRRVQVRVQAFLGRAASGAQ